MELEKLFGKRVVAETDNKRIFRGLVIDYLTVEENDGKESIVVKNMNDNKLYELSAEEIKSVSVMN